MPGFDAFRAHQKNPHHIDCMQPETAPPKHVTSRPAPVPTRVSSAAGLRAPSKPYSPPRAASNEPEAENDAKAHTWTGGNGGNDAAGARSHARAAKWEQMVNISDGPAGGITTAKTPSSSGAKDSSYWKKKAEAVAAEQIAQKAAQVAPAAQPDEAPLRRGSETPRVHK